MSKRDWGFAEEEADPPSSQVKWKGMFGVSGPQERCRGCGEDKPAGFRNFCPSCHKYPAEVLSDE